jgi:RNA polymerase sigma factor FliA
MTNLLCQEPPNPGLAGRSKHHDLWNRYLKCGPGSDTENEVVKTYLPLVKTIVGRLALTLPSHVNHDDLYSAGLIGLLNAIRRFDVTTGASFETYARQRIRGAVLDELRRVDWVPRSIHDKARRLEKVMKELEQEHGAVPTEAQMAKALNLSINDYLELLDEIRPATFICLDSARSNETEEGASAYESVPDDSQKTPVQQTVARETARLIAARIEQLPEAQRKVLALYYYEDLRLREIAEVFGVTESRICQIHAQAVLAVKSYLLKHGFAGG